MKPPVQIETKRLLLRIPRMEDAPAVFEGWARYPEATRFLA
jgi:RimJ/RimL family protein N-acetyltransferase